jgi:hypothetical protein
VPAGAVQRLGSGQHKSGRYHSGSRRPKNSFAYGAERDVGWDRKRGTCDLITKPKVFALTHLSVDVGAQSHRPLPNLKIFKASHLFAFLTDDRQRPNANFFSIFKTSHLLIFLTDDRPRPTSTASAPLFPPTDI